MAQRLSWFLPDIYNTGGVAVFLFDWLAEASPFTSSTRKKFFNQSNGKKNKIPSYVKTNQMPKVPRPVIQVDAQGNTKTFQSAREAARQTDINHILISRCCRGEAKSAGHCQWFYVDEYEHQTASYYLWCFNDDELLQQMNDAIETHSVDIPKWKNRKRRKEYLLIPKYLFFVHELIKAGFKHKSGNGVLKINMEMFAENICAHQATAVAIKRFWVDAGVVEVVSTSSINKEGIRTSSTYRLTEPYRKRKAEKCSFGPVDGKMFEKLLKADANFKLADSDQNEQPIELSIQKEPEVQETHALVVDEVSLQIAQRLFDQWLPQAKAKTKKSDFKHRKRDQYWEMQDFLSKANRSGEYTKEVIKELSILIDLIKPTQEETKPEFEHYKF